MALKSQVGLAVTLTTVFICHSLGKACLPVQAVLHAWHIWGKECCCQRLTDRRQRGTLTDSRGFQCDAAEMGQSGKVGEKSDPQYLGLYLKNRRKG